MQRVFETRGEFYGSLTIDQFECAFIDKYIRDTMLAATKKIGCARDLHRLGLPPALPFHKPALGSVVITAAVRAATARNFRGVLFAELFRLRHFQ
jgi:hypothetical protein